MATGIVKITDIVVPEIFGPYVQQLTEEKSRLVQSGAVARDAAMDALLAGGGLTFNTPSWNDLDNDADNVSTDDDTSDSVANKLATSTEIQVRLSRNQHWSDMDLATALAGADPLESIATRVANYWSRRAQAALVATMNGVIADNTANDAGDYTNDITGVFLDGVTNVSAEAVIDAAQTLGDSSDQLSLIMVHSQVMARMKKNNLIDFIPDARGEVNIPTFLGYQVIADDGLPVSTNDYDTWLFGPGAVRWGVGTPSVPAEAIREPAAGDGGGQENLHSRVEWAFHPAGHAYVGTAASGGPSNAATSNNLAAAASWNRVFPERKQIKFARLVTTEA